MLWSNTRNLYHPRNERQFLTAEERQSRPSFGSAPEPWYMNYGSCRTPSFSRINDRSRGPSKMRSGRNGGASCFLRQKEPILGRKNLVCHSYLASSPTSSWPQPTHKTARDC